MQNLTYTIDQISRLADQYIEAHGPDEWQLVRSDTSGLVVPDELVDKVQALNPDLIPANAVKAECRKRIYAEIDATAQANLSAVAAAGDIFSAQQLTDYKAGLAWISAMRAKCAELITNNDATYTNNAHWPAIPAAAKALADLY